MPAGIEKTVRELNVKQAKGIFKVPKEINQRQVLMNWKKNVVPSFKQVPLVVLEEAYYRWGLETKLKLDRRRLEDLVASGLLRPQKSKGFAHYAKTPLSTLSLAQTISWAFGKPIEQVLVSEKAFQQEDFLRKKPSTRVRILYTAYFGCRWFEAFRKRQKRIAKKVKIPKLKPGQRVSRRNLEDWFIGNYAGLIRKLSNVGLIIPQNGRFVSKSLHNLVDIDGLAQLVALLYDTEKDTILQDEKHDRYLKELADSFIKQRLLPYLVEHRIYPDSTYPISKSAKLTGINYNTLHGAMQGGAVRNVKFRGAEKTKVRGIDLAIYVLKNTGQLVFTEKHIAALFGIDSVSVTKLGFSTSPRGTYSRHHYVFPTYDLVTNIARRKVMKENALQERFFPVLFGKGIFYLSELAARRYCEEHGAIQLDKSVIEEIQNELKHSRQKQRVLTSDSGLFYTHNRQIYDFRPRK